MTSFRIPGFGRVLPLLGLALVLGATAHASSDALFDQVRLGMPKWDALPVTARVTKIAGYPGDLSLSFTADGKVESIAWRRAVGRDACRKELPVIVRALERDLGIKLEGPLEEQSGSETGLRRVDHCFRGGARETALSACCNVREQATPPSKRWSYLLVVLGPEKVEPSDVLY